MRKYLLFTFCALLALAALSGCSSAANAAAPSATPAASAEAEPAVLAGQITAIGDGSVTLAAGVLKTPSDELPSGTPRPHPTGLGKPPTRDDVASAAPSASPADGRDSAFELTGETVTLTVTPDTVISSCSGAATLSDLAVGNVVSYTAAPDGTALTINTCFGRKPA